MPTQVHRDQQAFIRQQLVKRRGYQVTGRSNGSHQRMLDRDAARRDDYERLMARMLDVAEMLGERGDGERTSCDHL